jgi:hypothetical protein
MSIYGHYTQQYYGNKIDFPEQSFLISGISFYKENCKNINYETELNMELEPTNQYDSNAISILHNNKKIGYVPTIKNIKELCKNNISEPLKIINIKNINGIIGIRVILKSYFMPYS